MSPPHPPILGTLQLHWPDEAGCAASARALARGGAASLQDARIELDGPLGAGKTTFTRHLLHALGVRGAVKSPTYGLVEPYALPGLHVAHFDFYRFDDPQEWEDAGLRDEFARPGLKLVEWAARAAPLLPSPDLRLDIAPRADDARDVTCEARSARGLALLQELAA